jgi:hypothetical protein
LYPHIVRVWKCKIDRQLGIYIYIYEMHALRCKYYKGCTIGCKIWLIVGVGNPADLSPSKWCIPKLHTPIDLK